MGILVSTGEVLETIDAVTTVKEIQEIFPEVSRGALTMWRYQDKFTWRLSGRTVLIDFESFLEFYRQKRPQRLDTDSRSV